MYKRAIRIITTVAALLLLSNAAFAISTVTSDQIILSSKLPRSSENRKKLRLICVHDEFSAASAVKIKAANINNSLAVSYKAYGWKRLLTDEAKWNKIVRRKYRELLVSCQNKSIQDNEDPLFPVPPAADPTATSTPTNTATPTVISTATPTATPTATVDPGAHPNDRSILGMNAGRHEDWTPNQVFVDNFKQAREWSAQGGGVLDLDTSGWVRSLQSGQSALSYLFVSEQGGFKLGSYDVLYDGEGTIQYGGGGKKDNARSKAGHDVVDIAGLTTLTITATDPNKTGNYIRNIRVISPGGVCSDDMYKWCADDSGCDVGASCDLFIDNYQTQLFDPTFLNDMKSYGTVRFMDWFHTNMSANTSFAERALPSDAFYTTDKGVPFEIATELANILHANPWYTVSDLYDQSSVTELATLIRDNLDPTLKIYLEFSNEVWNGLFPQAQRNSTDASASGRTAAQQYAYRSVNNFRTFKRVFGDHSRLERIMAWQFTGSSQGAQALDYIMPDTGTAAYLETDAYAVAPYFGINFNKDPSLKNQVCGWSVQQVLDYITNETLPQHPAIIQASLDVVNARKNSDNNTIKLIMYEHGQALLVPNGVPDQAACIEALFRDANLDAGMKAVYETFYNNWLSIVPLYSDTTIGCHFNSHSIYDKYGFWGIMYYQGDYGSPKYLALMDLITKHQ